MDVDDVPGFSTPGLCRSSVDDNCGSRCATFKEEEEEDDEMGSRLDGLRGGGARDGGVVEGSCRMFLFSRLMSTKTIFAVLEPSAELSSSSSSSSSFSLVLPFSLCPWPLSRPSTE